MDSVAHRHFEDTAEAIKSLKAQGAFVCALETTENASSLFDVVFPLPSHPPFNNAVGFPTDVEKDCTIKVDNNGGAESVGMEDGGNGFNLDSDRAAQERLEFQRNGEEAGAGKRELVEGGFVALVLGNEVTGVDERVLRLCDLVVEVRENNVERGMSSFIS